MSTLNKRINRSLPHKFTEQETGELAKKLATKIQASTSLDEEKKAVNSDFKARADMYVAEINLLSGKISNGFESRLTECELKYHFPNDGDKTITRLDTLESWTERMDSDEWNLFNQALDSEPQPDLFNQDDDQREGSTEVLGETPAGESFEIPEDSIQVNVE